MQDERQYWLESGPLDWLLPGTAWSSNADNEARLRQSVLSLTIRI
ncbi:MAG: hypothetical protein R3E31_07540 [Chloroflexota bacterium]